MLHDNLITENFLHHIQKENNLEPKTQNSSAAAMNLLTSFHYKQMQHQLLQNPRQLPPNEVLDLSKRCSIDSPPSESETSSPSSLQVAYHHQSLTSPKLNDDIRKSLSPVQRTDHLSASLLADNLHRFYNQTNLLPSNGSISPLNNNNIQSKYPIYYPKIKTEPNESSSALNNNSTVARQHIESHQNISSLPSSNILPQIPQPIGNLFPSNDHLINTSTYSMPHHHQKLNELNTVLPHISPKSSSSSSGVKCESIIDNDRISDISSIPGSPSSSTSIIYPKPILNKTTTTSMVSNSSSDTGSINKVTRPFKAFPRDPLVIAANFAAADVLYDNPRVERYTEYRKRVLEHIRSANGGERTISNPKMRRLNTRTNYNNVNNNNNNINNNTNISSDGSYSDSQANNSEIEDHNNDSSSDNDVTVQSTTNYESNLESQNTTNSINNMNGIIKDAAYYERRRKNNAAAKKSRDRRRIKEDEIAIRAAYLERQNIELLCQLDALKAQIAALTKVQSS